MALLNIGEAAPAFRLRTQDGVTVSLDDYRGHHVVLWWYPKADTPG